MLVLDDDFLAASQLSEEELKLEVIIASYRSNKIGWGKGAEILGITQMQMWKELAKRGLDVIQNDETYKKEFQNL